MKTNTELQTDVQNAIKWEPLLDAAEIGVTAKDGVVSLTGEVDSYVKKMEAENAAKNVIGVTALIEKIEVKFPSKWIKTDADIVDEVLKALKISWLAPSHKVNVKVENGWVTLSGELPWKYQSEAAKNAVHYLCGVTGVSNNITIKPETHRVIEQQDVEIALRRSFINDSEIRVKVSETTVTLSGTVNSWYQKEEAERIAWKSPGICDVKNQIEIDYYNALVSE